MKNTIRFIHAADLHLDSPFVGLKHLPSWLFERLRESTFLAFSRLISFAIKEQVDFVLLAGDLYDGEERSLKAQLRLKKEFERLQQASIDVFVIHGNHDHMGGKWLDLQWPDNVHVFSSNQVEMKIYHKNKKPAAYIYGYSYPTRSVVENMTANYRKQDNSTVHHIGMLHGSIEGNKEHDVYCPFKVNELLNKDFDYWALGHIHKRQLLHEKDPIIAYPGNIQGRHRKESGEKGFYYVVMQESITSSATFIGTEEVIWKEAEVSIDGLSNVSDLLQKCTQTLAQINHQATCLTFVFTGKGVLASLLQSQQTIQDIMDALNEDETETEHFVRVVKLVNKSYLPIENKNNPKLLSFFNDLQTTVDEYQSFDEVVEPLAQHPVYRKYLEGFTLEEQEQLLKEAEKLLHNELLQLQSEVK